MHQLTEPELELQFPFKKRCDEYSDFDYYAGCVIRKLRRERRMSGANIGRAIGYSQQQVSRYERGHSRFTFIILNEFAGVFDITLWDLLDAIKLYYFTCGGVCRSHENNSEIKKNGKWDCYCIADKCVFTHY